VELYSRDKSFEKIMEDMKKEFRAKGESSMEGRIPRRRNRSRQKAIGVPGNTNDGSCIALQ